MRRDQRPGLFQLLGQQVEPGVGRQFRVVVAHSREAKHFIERRCMPAAVLPQIDRQQMDAEHFDLTDQIVNRPVRGRLRADAKQVRFDHRQIVEECRTSEVQPLGRRFTMKPIGSVRG